MVAPVVMDPDPDGNGGAELLAVAVSAAPDESKRFLRLNVTFAE